MDPYCAQFVLSRDYLAECFDQSLPYGKNAKPNFLFPAFFFASGAALLLLTDEHRIVGISLIALAVLELLHIRFRRAWWLARQMWGASANSEVTLTVDDDGVHTQSPFVKTTLFWADVKQAIETDLGFILIDGNRNQQYLSKSLFPDGMMSVLLKDHANIEPNP